jgi:hypothetical protein
MTTNPVQLIVDDPEVVAVHSGGVPSPPVVESTPSRWVRMVGRLLLGLFLASAGLGHLTVLRQEFHAQVPPWFPVDPDVVVVASGVVEIALGLALIAAPRAYGPWWGGSWPPSSWRSSRATSRST